MLNSLRPKKIQACVLHFVASCWKRQHFDQCRVQEMGFSGCVILPSFGIQSLRRSKLCFGTVNPFTLRDRLGSNLLSPYHLSVKNGAFRPMPNAQICPDLVGLRDCADRALGLYSERSQSCPDPRSCWCQVIEDLGTWDEVTGSYMIL